MIIVPRGSAQLSSALGYKRQAFAILHTRLIMISLLSLAFLPFALAAPHNADPIHIPILRRTTTPEQRLPNLPRIMDSIRIKYGYTPVNQKRSTTYSPLTDEVRLFCFLAPCPA